MRRPALALAALLALGACGDNGGIVEVAWQFDDAGLNRIFPQGDRPDTCEFTSASGIRFDLIVRLRVLANSSACAANPDAEDCDVVFDDSFPCYRYRGTANPVPASAAADGTDDGYLMVVEALIDPTDTPPFLPDPTCIKSPGPRVRKVLPGRITDLELQQFIVAEPELTEGTADLDACRPSS